LHVEGTRVLCEAATVAGVKTIVLASSSGTIAVTDDETALPNETWPPPLDIITRWPYYASKYYQERVALEHFSGAGRRLVIVNPSLLLGPGDERLSSTKVGSANWTFDKFFGRLERLTKVAAPRFSLPSKFAVPGARALHSLYSQWKLAPPVEPAEIEMAEYFWYFDATKAARELGFAPRDASETLQDTVNYVRENFLGKGAFV
jgi:dihydroflavonol-4-reductase